MKSVVSLEVGKKIICPAVGFHLTLKFFYASKFYRERLKLKNKTEQNKQSIQEFSYLSIKALYS